MHVYLICASYPVQILPALIYGGLDFPNERFILQIKAKDIIM